MLIQLPNYIKRRCLKNIAIFHRLTLSTSTKPPWRILFFGTDEFSVNSLRNLNIEYKKRNLIDHLEVVTSMKSKLNPVFNYAKQEKLLTHPWPVTISSDKYDLGIVVSFGHLIPEDIINKFELGVINVHASLLPRWRGAAPIIHTIINEDCETGVTIMKIKPKRFDIGEIIKQAKIPVPENIIMPDLYQQLSDLGANTLIECVKDLPQCIETAQPQPDHGITNAPKITFATSQINWNQMTARQVYALYRALHNLYPLTTSFNKLPIKLYNIELFIGETSKENCEMLPGSVLYDKRMRCILVKCSEDSWITCSKIGLPARKPMSANDFNNGYLKKESVQNRFFK